MSEVIIIQHQATEGPGTIEEEILRAGHQVRRVRIDQGDKVPDAVGSVGGLVVMGGSMGVGDQGKLSHLKDEMVLIKKFVQADKPVLGICLGAQLLAARCTAAPSNFGSIILSPWILSASKNYCRFKTVMR